MRPLWICLFLAACGGPKGIAPLAEYPKTQLLPREDSALQAAVEKKRAGDPIGAWKLIEDIPVSSPARLDPRYDEVVGAYADARTKEIGAEIVGGRGGGPVAAPKTVTSAALTEQALDRYVNDRRASLRLQCYGDRSAPVSFHLRLAIDPDGRVSEAAVKDVRGDSTVAQCVRDQARTWAFPPSAEGADHPTRFYFAK